MITSQRISIVTKMHEMLAYPGLKIGDKIQVHPAAQIALLCTILCYITQVVELFKIWNEVIIDFDKLSESIILLSFYAVGLLKQISLRRYYKDWYWILKTIKTMEEEQIEIQNMESNENNENFDFNKYTNKIMRISNLLPKIYFGPLFIHILGPYVEFGRKRLMTSEKVDWPHLVPCWAPLDKFGFGGYLAGISLELITGVFNIFTHIAFDVIAFGTMIFTEGQFSLIRKYSGSIGSKNEMRSTKEGDDLAHKQIVKCHQLYITTKKTVSKLGMLLNYILGMYFLMVTILLCFDAVGLQNKITAIQLTTLALYMGASLAQLYMYCYFGDTVLHASYVGMGEGPFGSAIWSLSPRVKRELVLLGITMSETSRLQAGPFMYVDLPTFVQVVRAAYSYFAFVSR